GSRWRRPAHPGPADHSAAWAGVLGLPPSTRSSDGRRRAAAPQSLWEFALRRLVRSRHLRKLTVRLLYISDGEVSGEPCPRLRPAGRGPAPPLPPPARPSPIPTTRPC